MLNIPPQFMARVSIMNIQKVRTSKVLDIIFSLTR